jgi:predicted nuclease of predicted toxin-antitoxin system
MRLLFDQNLSPKLVSRLATHFRDALHVSHVGLEASPDDNVWEYAKHNDCCLVPKDSDFNDRLASKGFPPKVIWIRVGNCTTAEIVALLEAHHTTILAFLQNEAAGLLELQ